MVAHLDLERLHHLAYIAVGHDDHGIAVAIGQVEGQHGQIEHFLHGSRSQHQVAIAAMASTFHDAEVVALLGRDVAQSRAAAHDVDDYARQLSAGHVRDAFLHQAESRPGRRAHHALARRRRSVNHVDRRHFAFSLQERSADLGDQQGSILGDLAGRRDGISVEGFASGQYRAFHDGDITFTELAHEQPRFSAGRMEQPSLRAAPGVPR